MRYYRRRRRLGFTLLETAIIMVIVGTLALVSAPSFSSLLASVKLDQNVTELRTAFSSAQRAAIRSRQPCIASLRIQDLDSSSRVPQFQGGIQNQCAPSGDDDLSPGVSIVSNVMTSPELNLSDLGISVTGSAVNSMSQSEYDDFISKLIGIVTGYTCDTYGWWCSPEAGTNGDPNSRIVSMLYGNQGNVVYDVESGSKTPADPSGKFVMFTSSRPEGKQKCVAISRRLGLTRVGNYRGGITPKEITDRGVCTTRSWKDQ